MQCEPGFLHRNGGACVHCYAAGQIWHSDHCKDELRIYLVEPTREASGAGVPRPRENRNGGGSAGSQVGKPHTEGHRKRCKVNEIGIADADSSVPAAIA